VGPNGPVRSCYCRRAEGVTVYDGRGPQKSSDGTVAGLGMRIAINGAAGGSDTWSRNEISRRARRLRPKNVTRVSFLADCSGRGPRRTGAVAGMFAASVPSRCAKISPMRETPRNLQSSGPQVERTRGVMDAA